MQLEERLIQQLLDNIESGKAESDSLKKALAGEREKSVDLEIELAELQAELAESRGLLATLNDTINKVTLAVNQITYAKTELKAGSITSKRLDQAVAILNNIRKANK